MPRAYSQDLRERVIAAIEGEMSARGAARRFGVTASTLEGTGQAYAR